MPDTYGRTSLREFAHYDPESSSWRTSGAISLWGSTPYSGTWPRRGSMRNGACFEHPTWGPATSAHGSSWSLLPTPISQHRDRNTPEAAQDRLDRGHQVELSIAVHLLPTPVVNDMGAGKSPELWDEWTAAMQEKHGNGNGHGRSLAIEAMRLLPTPTAVQGRNRTSGRSNPDSAHHDGVTLNDWVRLLPTPTSLDASRPVETMDEWRVRQEEKKAANPNLGGLHLPLTTAVMDLLPTPAAWDGARGPDYARMNREGSGGDDLTTAMARLHGGGTNPRSGDGNTSSDDPPPPPPTTAS